MKTTIPQRELRNRSGEMLRRAEAGELLTITVDGRPVAQLGPVPRRRWIEREKVAAILRAGARDPEFFADVAELAGELAELDDRWERG